MQVNLRMSSLPKGLLNGYVPQFDVLLEQRRKLMIWKIETYFKKL